MKRRTVIAALLVAAIAGPRPAAAAVEFGPKQVAAMMLRVLAYDRNGKARTQGKAVPILLVYQEDNSAADTQQNDLSNALEDLAANVSVFGLPVKTVSVPYTNIAALESRIAAARPAAVFICTGLGEALPALTALMRKRAVLSMTLNTAYIKSGLSVSFSEGEDRIKVIINLPAARAEGADLDASLLRISEVYR